MKKLLFSEKGISLVITLLVMSVMLAIVLGVSSILTTQVKIVANAGDAVSALYAAESGIERTLYIDRHQLPAGGTRGFCNICNSCAVNKCLSCKLASMAMDGSYGCSLQNCTSCKVNYAVSFDDRKFEVTATLEDGVLNISSQGFYKEQSRTVKFPK